MKNELHELMINLDVSEAETMEAGTHHLFLSKTVTKNGPLAKSQESFTPDSRIPASVPVSLCVHTVYFIRRQDLEMCLLHSDDPNEVTKAHMLLMEMED